MKQESTFIFFPYKYLIVPSPFVKRLPFHIRLILVPGLNSILWVSFFTIYPVSLFLTTFIPMPHYFDYRSFMVLNLGQYWAMLETFFVVTGGDGQWGVLLASNG